MAEPAIVNLRIDQIPWEVVASLPIGVYNVHEEFVQHKFTKDGKTVRLPSHI